MKREWNPLYTFNQSAVSPAFLTNACCSWHRDSNNCIKYAENAMSLFIVPYYMMLYTVKKNLTVVYKTGIKGLLIFSTFINDVFHVENMVHSASYLSEISLFFYVIQIVTLFRFSA